MHNVVFRCLLLGLVFSPSIVTAGWVDTDVTEYEQDSKQNLTQLISQSRLDIANSRSSQAFNRLAAYEASFAGIPEFDYWLGVAAVREQQWFEASLALQRAVQMQPNHAGARLELIGVYIQQKQWGLAEAQLNSLTQLLEQAPAPESALQVIAHYRALLTNRDTDLANMRIRLVGFDVGYDSNYLNYPDQFDIFASTVFEGLAIFEADSSTYTQVKGHYYQRLRVDEDNFLEFSIGGNGRWHANSKASVFDTFMVTGVFNYGRRQMNGNEARVGLELGRIWLDNQSYREHIGVAISHMMHFSEQRQWQNRFYVRQFSFEDSLFSFRAYGGETSWYQHVSGPWAAIGSFQIEYEDAFKALSRQGGSLWRTAASTRLTYQAGNGHQFGGQLSFQSRRYQDIGFAVFNFGDSRRRRDETWALRLDWHNQVNSKLRFHAFSQWRDQRSNVDFFDVDQWLLQGGLTYAF